MKNKLFWGWVAVEVAFAGYIGWQIANAEARPWARKKTKKRTPLPESS